MKKILIALVIVSSLLAISPVMAFDADLGQDINRSLKYGEATGLGTQDIRTVAMLLVNVILGFLTVVAILLVIWGGYKWMMSQGNENEVALAKRIILSAIIGMAVIFSSYAITLFVLRSLVNVSR